MSRQLEVRDLSVNYGEIAAVRGLDLSVAEGEVVALLGANGAGKSTTLKAILGMVKARRGAIVVDGRDVTGEPTHAIARAGVALVPEGRRIFKRMTVHENLLIGGTVCDAAAVRRQLDAVHALFPRLKERAHQLAGTLSGGEQQMLAIGRAMMMRPRFVLFDEPSLGLAPLVVEDVVAAIRRITREFGIGAVLVEQNAEIAFGLATRACVLSRGAPVLSGASRDLRGSDALRNAYLGMGN